MGRDLGIVLTGSALLPLSILCPELRSQHGSLALEFCRKIIRSALVGLSLASLGFAHQQVRGLAAKHCRMGRVRHYSSRLVPMFLRSGARSLIRHMVSKVVCL